MKNGIILVLLASVMMFSCDSATNFSPELIQDEAVIQDVIPAKQRWSTTFYTPTFVYEVTIRSENGVVTVLDLPKGVSLTVSASMAQYPSLTEYRQNGLLGTYQGDIIIIRMRRADEIEKDEGPAGMDIVAKAPLEMTLTNAVVVVRWVEYSG